MALAGEGQPGEKSGFAEMIDTDDIQKCFDLLDDEVWLFYCVAAFPKARLLTPPHMLMFGSIATPQEVLINDLAPPGSFFSKMDFTFLTNAGEAVKRAKSSPFCH